MLCVRPWVGTTGLNGNKMQPVLSRRIFIYHLLSYKTISLNLLRIKAKVGPSPASFSYCSCWRDLQGKLQDHHIEKPVLLTPWESLELGVQLPVQVGGHSAPGILTQRPNTGVPTDHSNFQRVVIKLVKLNVLVNKTFWVCLICSKIFSKIENELMLYNILGMLFFFLPKMAYKQ